MEDCKEASILLIASFHLLQANFALILELFPLCSNKFILTNEIIHFGN